MEKYALKRDLKGSRVSRGVVIEMAEGRGRPGTSSRLGFTPEIHSRNEAACSVFGEPERET